MHWQEFLLRIVWYGGSTFDAWLNISSAKMSARILTMPQSTTEMGLASGFIYQVFQAVLGLWVHHVLSSLYLRYRESQNPSFSMNFKTTTQLHEVIGGLLGRRWGAISLFFNTSSLFFVSALQLLACSNIVHVLNDKLPKRTWTSLFAVVFSLSIFIPSAHNYRVWSFIGVITTIFVSGYLFVAALVFPKISGVRHASPSTYQEFFRGVSGITIIGHIVIPIEIMDAMWKPKEYPSAYGYAQLYVLLVSLFPSFMMNRRFGDRLLSTANAFALFPATKFRDASIILVLIHQVSLFDPLSERTLATMVKFLQFINFGMYSLAAYALWEKLVRVHGSSSYKKRILWRIPVFLIFCLAALAFPFFGIINRVFDSSLLTWNFYIIPCVAYNVVYWPRGARRGSSPILHSWVVDFSLNAGVALWVLVVECGLALWGNVDRIRNTRLELFARCYDCK